MELSNSISELYQPDEDKCRQILAQVKWKGIPTCPRCQCQKVYFLKTTKIYKCSDCKKQFSLIQDTIFERTKLPLSKWFQAIRFFLLKASISSAELSRQLNLPQHTTWYMLMKLRTALNDENEPLEMLKGFIEADETFFGFDKGQDLARSFKLRNDNKERKKKGLPILEHQIIALGIVKRKEHASERSRVIIRSIGQSRKAINKENIVPLLKKYIDQRSYVVTDNAPVYKKSCCYFEGYDWIVHTKRVTYTKKDGTETTRLIKQFVDKNCEWVHTNTIEGVWSRIKPVWRLTYTHFSYKHSQRYFDEFAFRLNNTKDPFALQEIFLKRTIGKSITKKQLIA